MPRVSSTHLAARRTQIVAGARRCFAELGYEGATVRQLEKCTNLSRGAIFHHFADKESLFLAVAADNAEHMTHIIREAGLVGVMRDLVKNANSHDSVHTDGLRIQREVDRRVRTDAHFAARWAPIARSVSEAIRMRLERGVKAGSVRRDVPLDVIQSFLELTFDGLIGHLSDGRSELEPILDLVETATRGR